MIIADVLQFASCASDMRAGVVTAASAQVYLAILLSRILSLLSQGMQGHVHLKRGHAR